jgi:hypothetical protein
MNRRRPRRSEVLTEGFIRAVRAPSLYGDGNCLYLKVDGSGSRRWFLRTMVQGKRRDIGLGGLTTTGLAEARLKAQTYRTIARAGGDPLTLRDEHHSRAPSTSNSNVSCVLETKPLNKVSAPAPSGSR